MTSAIAMVKFSVFRSTDENREKFGKAYWYKSKNKRLVDLVAKGGTLWVVTSLKKGDQRTYSLAYKLVDCSPLESTDLTKDAFGRYGVIGKIKSSDHYGMNAMNDVLMELEFDPAKPINNNKVIGLSLLSIRKLTKRDEALLKTYEEKVKFGKKIFISYASRDRIKANQIANFLISKGHEIWMDHRYIVGGEQWNDFLNKSLKSASYMIVLISKNSADSKWVKYETEFAAGTSGKVNGYQKLIPIVLEQDAWSTFNHLQHLHFLKYEQNVDSSFYKKLSNDLEVIL